MIGCKIDVGEAWGSGSVSSVSMAFFAAAAGVSGRKDTILISGQAFAARQEGKLTRARSTLRVVSLNSNSTLRQFAVQLDSLRHYSRAIVTAIQVVNGCEGLMKRLFAESFGRLVYRNSFTFL